MPIIAAGPLRVDTDNKTLDVTVGTAGVHVDGNNGTVTVTEPDGTTHTVDFGNAPQPPSPLTNHYIRGRVVHFPTAGGLLIGVPGAMVRIFPLGDPGSALTLTTDSRGVYAGPVDDNWLHRLFAADVSHGSHAIGNVALPYNPVAAEFFPIIVPLDWREPAVPVKDFFRRRNLLSEEFSDEDRRELADFIRDDFLPRDTRSLPGVAHDHGEETTIVDLHMEQIDHMHALFTDHRSFIWELEKALIRAGKDRFVPLPVWEPIDDIPDRFERVFRTHHMLETNNPIYWTINPIYNRIDPSFRPLVPDALKPANLPRTNFPDAHTLALYLGRSAASAPDSFHFSAHLMPGGPFFDMMFAAGAVLFWPLHALLVDMYDNWVGTRVLGAGLRWALGTRTVAGRPYLMLFAVAWRGELWESHEREIAYERNDLTLLDVRIGVQAVFDPDRVLRTHEPAWPHWSHWMQLDPGCALVELKTANDHLGGWLLLGRDRDGHLCLVRETECHDVTHHDLATTTVHVYACEGAGDGTLQVVFAGPGSATLELGSETAVRSSAFTWTRKALPTGRALMPAVRQIKTILGRDGKVHVFASMRPPHDHQRRAGAHRPAGHVHVERGRHSTISMELPPSMFHLMRQTDGQWVLDEPLSYLPLSRYCVGNCHDDCIRVFGIHDLDRTLHVADIPVEALQETPASEPADLHNHGAHAHVAHGHGSLERETESPPITLPRDVADRLARKVAWKVIETGGLELRDLAACNRSDGTLELFAIDLDGRVWHAGEWSDWETWMEIPLLTVMGTDTRGIAAAMDYSGCVKVFIHCGREEFIYVAEQEAAESDSWIGWVNV